MSNGIAVDAGRLAEDHPLELRSDLPYQLPPFARITPEHCREALLVGMVQHRAELAAITARTEPPTFENTLVALEIAGDLLTRAWGVFGNLAASVSTPRLREIEREIA